MKLHDYEVLNNEVFYRCWHILDYIEAHPDMSPLELIAIKATIMDALVTRKQIDATRQSLDLDIKKCKDRWCIQDNLNYYVYEKYPNVCGIPLGIKDELRKHCIRASYGIPISMFLAKPPSKSNRYCVYDPNNAFSYIFSDVTFYHALYDSPTRNIRITEPRPFVEVPINGELYLIDTLTKRIFKSSWFKEKYNFEEVNSWSLKTANKIQKEGYAYFTETLNELSINMGCCSFLLDIPSPDLAEYKYELNESKKYFPEEWEKYERFEEFKRLERKRDN